jgi:stage II sporulation protein D
VTTQPPTVTDVVVTTTPLLESTKRKYSFVVEPPKIAVAVAAVEKPTANELEQIVTTVPETALAETTTTPVTTPAETATTTAETTTARTETSATTVTTTAAATATTADLELYEVEDDDAEIIEDDIDLDLQIIDEPDLPLLDDTTVTAATKKVVDENENVIYWDVDNGVPAVTTSTQTTLPLYNTPQPSVPAAATLTARFGGSKQTVDAFTLICAVTANEVSTSFDDDAIKAQAIAAYSYIKNANDNGDAPDISVDYDYSDKIERNVREIWGLACYHNGKVASTVYSASSAGYTASSENVWGGVYPYLVSVATPFDAGSDPNYGVLKTFTESDIRGRLESYLGSGLSSNPANWIVITGYTDGSYVDSVSLDGQTTVSGRKFRENVMDFDIRSASFDIFYSNGVFTVTTYGYGHGVGMSQNGANILAEQGYSFEQILKYYYTGIEVL